MKLHELASPFRVVDDGLDLPAVADDARILQESGDVALREAREHVEIEVAEGGAKVFAFREDGAPSSPLNVRLMLIYSPA